jgi:DNA-binding NarL/FixJ family response regulator
MAWPPSGVRGRAKRFAPGARARGTRASYHPERWPPGADRAERIRVLIADDHDRFREGLRALLGAAPDVEVAGDVATGDDAVARARALQPDVVLMDVKMPGLDGIEATRRIVHTSPHIAVLVLTMLEDDDSVFAALRAGARGYLLKGALKAEILRAVRAVASGEAIFGPAIARRLMQYFAAPRPSALAQAFPELTERERDVLRLIAEHHPNLEIAERLGLSPKTVRNHVSNVFSKLQVADRAQAIIRARGAGLGAAPGDGGLDQQ